jgi:hypothetical protein
VRTRVLTRALSLAVALAVVVGCGDALPAEDAAWCDAHPEDVLRTAFALGLTQDADFDAIQDALLDRDGAAIARFVEDLRDDRSAWEQACREATDLL